MSITLCTYGLLRNHAFFFIFPYSGAERVSRIESRPPQVYGVFVLSRVAESI